MGGWYDAASVHPIDLPEVLYYLKGFCPVSQVGGQLEADFGPGWSEIRDGSCAFALDWQLKQEPLRHTRAECESVLWSCHFGCVVPVMDLKPNGTVLMKLNGCTVFTRAHSCLRNSGIMGPKHRVDVGRDERQRKCVRT